MKALLTALAALSLLGPGVGTGVQAQGRPDKAHSDSAALQGTWTMIAGAADGAPMPANFVSQMKRVFDGTTLTVTMGGSPYFTATIALHPSTKPKGIDYHMTAGFTAGQLQLGIYRFLGDTAQFCFGAPGAPRPDSFDTHPGDKRTLSSWLQAKP